MHDLVASGAMPKEALNWTQGDVMNQFISGNLAMMVNGPWQIPTMRQQAPNLKWNVALLPVGNKPASDLGGENFAVVKGNNVDEAVTFLKFVASPAEMKTYINAFGYIASRKDVAATQFTSDPLIIRSTRCSCSRWPWPSRAVRIRAGPRSRMPSLWRSTR